MNASRRAGWSSNMESRAQGSDAKQVKCLTSDEGHVWMPSYDTLPKPVRERLANSPHNICAACMEIEAHKHGRHPSIATYFKVIAGIERQLNEEEDGK
jgi:hypothetical protein